MAGQIWMELNPVTTASLRAAGYWTLALQPIPVADCYFFSFRSWKYSMFITEKIKLERERIPRTTLHRDNGPENIRALFFAFGFQSFLLHKCQLWAFYPFWGRHWLDAHLLGEASPSCSESLKLRDWFGPQEMVDCPPLWPWPAAGHPFSGCSIKVGLGGEWEGKKE